VTGILNEETWLCHKAGITSKGLRFSSRVSVVSHIYVYIYIQHYIEFREETLSEDYGAKREQIWWLPITKPFNIGAAWFALCHTLHTSCTIYCHLAPKLNNYIMHVCILGHVKLKSKCFQTMFPACTYGDFILIG